VTGLTCVAVPVLLLIRKRRVKANRQ